ncbi:MAG: hypothetical protein AAFP19_09475 [Bacteroidota bacterium]
MGQKFIQLERYGKVESQKFYIGERLTFRLKDDKRYWYKDVIRDILVDEKIIVFENRAVKIEDIDALRTYPNARWSSNIARSLYVFGVGYAFFSLAGTVFGWELTWGTAIVPAVAFATGWLIRKIFRRKTHRLGKRRWLRAVDINVIAPAISP